MWIDLSPLILLIFMTKIHVPCFISLSIWLKDDQNKKNKDESSLLNHNYAISFSKTFLMKHFQKSIFDDEWNSLLVSFSKIFISDWYFSQIFSFSYEYNSIILQWSSKTHERQRFYSRKTFSCHENIEDDQNPMQILLNHYHIHKSEIIHSIYIN